MTDPKIKYDIEAGVSGDANVQQLEGSLRALADTLGGGLRTQALEAADALQALGAKQQAIETFNGMRRAAQQLGADLDIASAKVDRLGAELPAAAEATSRFAAAETRARAAVEGAREVLDEQRAALAALRAEYTGGQRRTDEYRQSNAQLLVTVRELRTNLTEKRQELAAAVAATRGAQQQERQLNTEYTRSVEAARKLSAQLGDKNRALDESRAALAAVGIQTGQLAQAERNLEAAIASVRERVTGMSTAFAQAAAASDASTQRQVANQRTLREGMTSISTQLQQIQQIATVALGGSFLVQQIRDVAATADGYKNLQARIKLATGEGEGFRTSFQGVSEIALRTNSALEETGTLFVRLAQAGTQSGMQAQAAQQQALALTQTINQSIQLSGSSAEASKAAITQLIQGIQSGVLRGEEFNSVMEQAPRLAQALAQGLNVTTGELRRMAEQGALTTNVVIQALTRQSATVEAEFGKLPMTVGRALQNLQTQWSLYVGASDNGMASSANLARIINALANNLDTLVATLTAAGKAWAAIKIAGLAADLYRWATATVGATAALENNTRATAANTAAHAANATATRASAAGHAAAGAAAATGATQASTALSGLAGAAMRANIYLAVLANAKELGTWLGESAAKLMGHGKALKEAEDRTRALDEASRAAAEASRQQAARTEDLRLRQFALTKDAVGLINSFDQMRLKGESAAEAIAKIGKDFDLSTVEGIRTANGVLDKLATDGKITAAQFQAAWASALAGVDLGEFETRSRLAFMRVQDDARVAAQKVEEALAKGASGKELIDLQENARAAFAAVSRASEQFAQGLDAGVREAIRRTGLEFDVLAGGMGKAARSAINDTDAIIQSLEKLRAQGVDTSAALTASLSRGIQTADSQKAIEALRGQIESVRRVLGDRVADGLLRQASEQADELRLKVEQLKPGIQSATEAMRFFGLRSSEALRSAAADSRDAYDALKNSGLVSANQLREAFTRMANDAIAANKGIAPSWLQTEDAILRSREATETFGRSTVETLDRVGSKWREYGQIVRQEGAAGMGVIGPNQTITSTIGGTREQRLLGQNAVDAGLQFRLRDKLRAGTLGSGDLNDLKAVVASLMQQNQINGEASRMNAGFMSLEGQRDAAAWQATRAQFEQAIQRLESPGRAERSTRHDVKIELPNGARDTFGAASADDARKLVDLLSQMKRRSS